MDISEDSDLNSNSNSTSTYDLPLKISFVILLLIAIFGLSYIFIFSKTSNKKNTNKKVSNITTNPVPTATPTLDPNTSPMQKYFSGNVVKGDQLKNPENYCKDQYYLSFDDINLRLTTTFGGAASWPQVFNKFISQKIKVKAKYSKNDKLCELKNIKKCGCDDFLTVASPESDITFD